MRRYMPQPMPISQHFHDCTAILGIYGASSSLNGAILKYEAFNCKGSTLPQTGVKYFTEGIIPRNIWISYICSSDRPFTTIQHRNTIRFHLIYIQHLLALFTQNIQNVIEWAIELSHCAGSIGYHFTSATPKIIAYVITFVFSLIKTNCHHSDVLYILYLLL